MQVDVFSDKPCKGNPVCVFLSSDNLSTEKMQSIARWTNLSETTFLSPSNKGDYRVRIFTPSEELPFAGHPTLGSAWAFLESQSMEKSFLIQDCEFGLVELKKNDRGIFFKLPHYRILKEIERKPLEKSLNIKLSNDCQVIDTGPHWGVANIATPGGIDTLNLDRRKLKDFFTESHMSDLSLYEISNGSVFVRSFFESNGEIIEDPVCGSGNAAVAAHIKESGRIIQTGNSYQARQGKHVGRDGRVLVEIGENIMVGGRCNTVFAGEAVI